MDVNIKVEKIRDDVSGNSSIIFLSDCDGEGIDDDIDLITLGDSSDDKEEDGGITLQERRFVVTETVTKIEEPIVVQPIVQRTVSFDKATQTCEIDFPVQSVNADLRTFLDSRALSKIQRSSASAAVKKSSSRKEISNAQSRVDYCEIGNDKNQRRSNDFINDSNNNNRTSRSNHLRDNRSSVVSDPINNNNTSNESVKRTWRKTKTYNNYRVQPYENSNNWNDKSRNWNNYNRYGGVRPSYSNDYYTSYRKNLELQLYSRSFQNHLFHGFLNFMDYVFDYDFTCD